MAVSPTAVVAPGLHCVVRAAKAKRDHDLRPAARGSERSAAPQEKVGFLVPKQCLLKCEHEDMSTFASRPEQEQQEKEQEDEQDEQD